MKDKLISAKALLDELSVDEDWDKRVSLGGALADFIILICDAPAIEAKPVVYAHWESNQCSNCKGFALSFDNEPYRKVILSNFCPHCGARMDEPISQSHENGVKIPVISMEDVPKLAKEMENNV